MPEFIPELTRSFLFSLPAVLDGRPDSCTSPQTTQPRYGLEAQPSRRPHQRSREHKRCHALSLR